jgi:hypothetical protein
MRKSQCTSYFERNIKAMVEILKLIGILGIAVLCNILGGLYVNIGLNDGQFDTKKLLYGLAKAACVAAMFIGLSYTIEQIPSLSDTLGMEPKATLIAAIGVYSGKVVKHLSSIFGSDAIKKAEKTTGTEELEEYQDM